jgi:hypothetical protein
MKSFLSILAFAALAASGTALACDDGYAMSDDGIATKAPEKPVVLADKASTGTPLVVKQKQPAAAKKAQGKPLPAGVTMAKTSQ